MNLLKSTLVLVCFAATSITCASATNEDAVYKAGYDAGFEEGRVKGFDQGQRYWEGWMVEAACADYVDGEFVILNRPCLAD